MSNNENELLPNRRGGLSVTIFAIGDPHLSKAQPKPMAVFGCEWEGHPEVLFANWRQTVGPGDTVLIPGDISWALHETDALLDLQDIDALPGHKVLIQGNHDYWWQSISRLRRLPLTSISFVQNDHVMAEDVAVCGTRGWILPHDRAWAGDPAHNAKIYAREAGRLQLSLASAVQAGAQRIIAMMHYPPLGDDGQDTEFTRILAQTPGVYMCLYGHLHSPAGHRRAFEGTHGGVEYRLVACDAIGFKPVRVRGG